MARTSRYHRCHSYCNNHSINCSSVVYSSPIVLHLRSPQIHSHEQQNGGIIYQQLWWVALSPVLLPELEIVVKRRSREWKGLCEVMDEEVFTFHQQVMPLLTYPYRTWLYKWNCPMYILVLASSFSFSAEERAAHSTKILLRSAPNESRLLEFASRRFGRT